jgi:hypothetical protein
MNLPGPGEWRTLSLQTEALFLIACQGDDTYDESGGGNDGIGTFEVAGITVPDGHLSAWVEQAEDFAPGQFVLGHEALLYFDYLWVFQGVAREMYADGAPDPQESAAQRFDWVDDAALPDDMVANFQSTSASQAISRAYYSMIRLNSHIFIIGGNGGPGVGPLATLERVIQ